MIASKKLLFLGGGRSNINAIKSALELGIKPYVVGMEGNYPGYKLAEKIFIANIMDKYDVMKAIKDEKIDGVLICCSDRAIETVGFLNDHLGLNGITESAAKRCNNKYEMKQALFNKGVNTAKFMKLEKEADLKRALELLTFPVIVKAVDLQSSKGVYICKDETELMENYCKSISESNLTYCIVEEFIEGRELGAQAFVCNGKIVFVLPHGDIIAHEGKSTVPVGHYAPLDCSEKLRKRIAEEAGKAIDALELNNCAVNIDFIVKDDVPYILELSGRVGANCLPEMTGYHYGMDYYKTIVAVAVGEDPFSYFTPNMKGKITLVKMINSAETGVLELLEYDKDMLPYVSFFVNKGDKVSSFKNSNDCIGEMLVQGDTMEECEEKIRKFYEKLVIRFK